MGEKGLRHTKGANRITNLQHHDASGAARSIEGTPLTIAKVISTSTTPTPVNKLAVIRAANLDVAFQFVWIGKENEVPGTIDVTTGVAIPPGDVEIFLGGNSEDPYQDLVVVSSSDLVQLVLMG